MLNYANWYIKALSFLKIVKISHVSIWNCYKGTDHGNISRKEKSKNMSPMKR